jgi:hypothetical protein
MSIDPDDEKPCASCHKYPRMPGRVICGGCNGEVHNPPPALAETGKHRLYDHHSARRRRRAAIMDRLDLPDNVERKIERLIYGKRRPRR